MITAAKGHIEKRTMQGSTIEYLQAPPLNPLNRNILIVGASGCGKSTLQRLVEKQEQPALKLIFKEDGEKSFSIAKNRPFIEQDKVNFVDSWKTSKQTDSIGYMLSQEQLFIEEARQEGDDLIQLRQRIESGKKNAERIDKPIWQLIESRLSHLYPSAAKEIRSTGKISMAELTEDEYIFFSDYILRNQYDELLNQIISIDEIHRLKPLMPQTIGRITREIRSRGGLIATSQSLTDLPPNLITNFGTIYQFQTLDKNDLQYLELIDEQLKQDVLTLEDHEFIEIRTYPRLTIEGNRYKMVIQGVIK